MEADERLLDALCNGAQRSTRALLLRSAGTLVCDPCSDYGAKHVVVDRGVLPDRLGPLGCVVQTGAGSILLAPDVRPGSSLVVFGTGRSVARP
jgi:hypothetical protein